MPIFPAFQYTPSGATEVTVNFTVPIGHSDEVSLRQKGRDNFGGTGIMQRQTDYVEERIIINQRFVPESERDALETMLKDHVIGGGSFKYIPDDTDLGTFDTVQLVDRNWDGATRDPLSLNLFRWTLNVRKVIT